jgi:hypothetical protein
LLWKKNFWALLKNENGAQLPVVEATAISSGPRCGKLSGCGNNKACLALRNISRAEVYQK